MHPDTFKTWDHGCAVQMLYKSFNKRASGDQRRHGTTDPVSLLTIDEISHELDTCFEALGYKNDEYPLHTDGVKTASPPRW